MPPGRPGPDRAGDHRVCRPARGDVAVAVLVSTFALMAPVTGGPGIASTGGWWGAVGVAVALGQGAPLAWRSCRLLGASVVVLASYAASALLVGLTPPIGPWFVIWSLGTAPEQDHAGGLAPRSRRVLTWGAGFLTCCLIVLAELVHPGAGASVLLALLTALAVTSTWMVRADRARAAALRESGAAAERLRLARELHDVVGHGLGVVAIQSSTARLALQRGDSPTASRAIGLVEAASRTAMRELRQMLGVLTEASPDQPGAALPGIAEIGELVQQVRDAGTPVELVSTGSWGPVPASLQLCAFRVVQEALTNVMKHAPGSSVLVEVGIRGSELVVSVTDSGPTQTATGPSTAGLGLAGLGARVDSLGGQLSAGPTATGWAVLAVIPVPVSAR